ncbi:MAG: N-acetylglucosamine-6-phosphate deacetylase [Clostridia bacterium]|nr:N-acetylglucosamine-6-phosphate deacetylase [Clostridia bacterium]
MKIIRNVKLSGELCDIALENGKIIDIAPVSAKKYPDVPGVDFGGNKIYPGLIDIHSHGAIGIDTMDARLDELAEFYLKSGTTTWYPTTLTMSTEDLLRATGASYEGKGANIPGFHLEGPYINIKRAGAQNPKYILKPSLEHFMSLGNIKLVTIAPDVEGAMEFIEKCPAVVCIGHTDCSYDVAMEAFSAGAKCLTHTFNAMPSIHHRNPGPIPAGADADAYAQLITDGVHVHPSVIRMLVKLYGTDRVVIISDSLPATHLSDGDYISGGLAVTVKNGTATLADGTIAGSTTTLFECVKRAISFGIKEEDAVKMASENPARLMGLNKGKIEVGYDADFIIVDEKFNLVRAIARGEI